MICESAGINNIEKNVIQYGKQASDVAATYGGQTSHQIVALRALAGGYLELKQTGKAVETYKPALEIAKKLKPMNADDMAKLAQEAAMLMQASMGSGDPLKGFIAALK